MGEIIKKVNKYPATLPQLKVVINIKDPLKTKMDKSLSKYSIYKLQMDLLTRTK